MLRILQRSTRFFKVLTKQEAFKRQQLIKPDSIQYSFHLNLHPGKLYEGLMQMKFQLNSSVQNVELDFLGKNIKQLFINGQSQQIKYDTERGKILLPSAALSREENFILIRYQNQYDNDGSGCVSFTDVDSKQYLYTQFQPYMANRVFPIFDQPDLKAKMKLAICFPEEWMTAISNQPIQQQTSIKNFDRKLFQIHAKFMRPKLPEKYDKFRQKVLEQYYQSISQSYKLTSFKETSLLPSYLYCFVVGPYKKFVCQDTYKNIPMSLYCIESLQPYLIKLRPYIQEMTNKSFEFFQGYFRCPYAFSKYDQIFAHEYKWGAMQNAGIVTLNDLYLFKDKVSDEKMLSFGNTIVHQLAHHWFGNLVTMKWWDDLWLNESFAEYISHFCLEKIKKNIKTLDYESAMLSFYIRKGWGYNEDELITTHSITGQVKNTHVAESIFDGITYSKGAATMKQLMYLIGEDNFSKALGQYFNKYKFRNTQLDDLLDCIQKYYPQMKEWKEMWLQKAGGNILSCEWSKNSSELKIYQTYVRPQHQTLRTHKINIGYILTGGSIHCQEVIIQNKNLQTFQIPPGIHPEAILLNYNDLTFAKISLDPISFKYLERNLHLIHDSLFRAMVWRTLYEMVRDGKMTSKQYLSFIVNNLKNQNSDTIVQEQLGYLHISLSQYTPEKYRTQLFQQIFIFIRKYLLSIDLSRKNRITILKDKLILFAYTQHHKKGVWAWFRKDLDQFKDNQFELNVSERWKALLKLFSATTISNQDKIKAFQEQKSIDSSDTMLKRKITCDVMLVKDTHQLESVYEKLLKMQHISSTTNYVCAMQGFNSIIHKKSIRDDFSKKYYQDLKVMLEENPSQRIDLKEDYKQEFMSFMDPIIDDNVEDLKNKRQEFEQIQPKNDKLRVLLLKKIDTLKRRQKAYKNFEKNYVH